MTKSDHEKERRAFCAVLVAVIAIGCGKGPNANPAAGECNYNYDGYRECLRLRPCVNEATLVATTSGSPNGATCDNQHHRMRVEPVTRAGEEIAALVFCECAKVEPKPAERDKRFPVPESETT